MERQDGSRSRLSLAKLDFLDSELRARAEQMLREAGPDLRPAACSGSDKTGTVTVVVDTQRNVEAVTIANDWRSTVGVGGFTDALFEAYTAAVQAALEQAALIELREESQAEPKAATPAQRAPVEAESQLDGQHWLRATWNTLHRLEAELDRLTRGPSAAGERTLSSPEGCLTLRIRGGSIVGITGDVARIGRCDAGQLKFEALDLFRAFARADSN